MATVKRTLADLSAAHDKKVMIPNRIRAAIAALASTGNDWVYELDFIKLALPPISGSDISKFRGQFPDFWAETPPVNGKSSSRKVWFATKALCAKWKASLHE